MEEGKKQWEQQQQVDHEQRELQEQRALQEEVGMPLLEASECLNLKETSVRSLLCTPF